MKAFQEEIKENVLMAAGMTLERYCNVASLNSFGYDPVDEIIITSARKLDRRYKKVFGLLYECHLIPMVLKRIRNRGYHSPDNEETIRRYMKAARASIIKLVIEDQKIMKTIKGILRGENE